MDPLPLLIQSGVVIRLLAAHLLADFLLWPARWKEETRQNRWRSASLYAHGIVAGSLAWLFAGGGGAVWIGILVGAIHVLIDGILAGYPDTVQAFLADQAAHAGTALLAGCIVLNSDPASLLRQAALILADPYLGVVVLGYLLIFWPTNILIGKCTHRWRESIEARPEPAGSEVSLEDAGRWIGYIERFLILSFILAGQYTAIGFLIAAKSIFRYPERRDRGEYILIGTLLSFSAAASVGLTVSWVLAGMPWPPAA